MSVAPRLSVSAGLALLLSLSSLPLAAQGHAVDGRDRALVSPPSGAVIEPYSNAGYRLTIDGGLVDVVVSAAPLGSQASFEPPSGFDRDDGISRLALSLVSGTRRRYEAVSRVLAWVSQNIQYELDRGDPQDAESVLRSRRGYCTGISRLTVALLQAAGIEAREVSGYVVDQDGGGYHRWVEVFYPDVGWSFSDPRAAHHFVPATYLRLASDRLDLSRLGDATLLERERELLVVDSAPRTASNVLLRRNDDRVRHASLQVDLDAPYTGEVELVAQDLVFRTEMRDGTASLVGVPPGGYTLRLLLGDGREIEQAVSLQEGQPKLLSLRLAGGAASSAERPAAPTAGMSGGNRQP